MRRYQLFEFLDQSWLPDRIRAAATLYLRTVIAATPFPALWAAVLARVLDECRLDHVVDLGSGSGGPMELVTRYLEKSGRPPHVTLTDLHPVPASASLFDYWPESVDAVLVPRELKGARTLFLLFHHFPPPMARSVLRDAFEQGQAICVFEVTSRTAAAIAASFLIPFLVLLVTPSIRPLSAFQIVFTYLIPIVPLLAFWDGFVSQLRTYSINELQELSAGFTSEDYSWQTGFIDAPRVPFKTCYLIGFPRQPLSGKPDLA